TPSLGATITGVDGFIADAFIADAFIADAFIADAFIIGLVAFIADAFIGLVAFVAFCAFCASTNDIILGVIAATKNIAATVIADIREIFIALLLL
ncbi:MAG: hypothetical protein H0U27_13220, partial [Nitrosopumilus sp.]|nr:hypothetical protein [Nitrosopumilus sp.]